MLLLCRSAPKGSAEAVKICLGQTVSKKNKVRTFREGHKNLKKKVFYINKFMVKMYLSQPFHVIPSSLTDCKLHNGVKVAMNLHFLIFMYSRFYNL